MKILSQIFALALALCPLSCGADAKSTERELEERDTVTGRYAGTAMVLAGGVWWGYPGLMFSVSKRGGGYALSGAIPSPEGEVGFELPLSEFRRVEEPGQPAYCTFMIPPGELRVGDGRRTFVGLGGVSDGEAFRDGMLCPAADPPGQIAFGIMDTAEGGMVIEVVF